MDFHFLTTSGFPQARLHWSGVTVPTDMGPTVQQPLPAQPTLGTQLKPQRSWPWRHRDPSVCWATCLGSFCSHSCGVDTGYCAPRVKSAGSGGDVLSFHCRLQTAYLCHALAWSRAPQSPLP